APRAERASIGLMLSSRAAPRPRRMAGSTWVLATAAALFVTGKASAHVASTASGGSERSPQSARGSQVVKRMPTLEERVISAINDFRRSRGLAPLRPNAELALAARAHSLSMA